MHIHGRRVRVLAGGRLHRVYVQLVPAFMFYAAKTGLKGAFVARLQFQYPGKSGRFVFVAESDGVVGSPGQKLWEPVCCCGAACVETWRPVLYETTPRTALCLQISQAKSTVSAELATGACFCLTGVVNVLLCGSSPPFSPPHTHLCCTHPSCHPTHSL